MGGDSGGSRITMMVKIISWNVRGLNDEGKRDLVRNQINQWGADVYILLETKLKDNISSLIRNIGTTDG